MTSPTTDRAPDELEWEAPHPRRKYVEPEHPALTAARRALAARKGPPLESDAPKRRGVPTEVLPGQLSLDEGRS